MQRVMFKGRELVDERGVGMIVSAMGLPPTSRVLTAAHNASPICTGASTT